MFSGKVRYKSKTTKIKIKYFVGKKKIDYSIKDKNLINLVDNKNFIEESFGRFSCYSVNTVYLNNILKKKLKTNSSFFDFEMKINLKRTIQFKNLSKDYNLIHYNKNFSSKFHFKSPIVHGINATLIALAKFLKVRKVTINSIKINFLNFILVNEKIFFQMFKNKIEIYNNLNKKIEIYLKTRKSQDKTKEKISYNVKKFLI